MDIELAFWWSVILGIPALIGFSAAFVVTRRTGDLGSGLAALFFPFGLATLAWLAYKIVDPDAGCSEECWGVIPYLGAFVGAALGAELGVVAGVLAKVISRRRRPPAARA